MHGKFHSGRRLYSLAAQRQDADRIRYRFPGLRRESVGGCEHLDWPGDIEQLDRRIGQHFDNAAADWRKARGFWRHRQEMLR